MPIFTFTNADSDGDLANTDNWNVGGSPAGALPQSTDTAVLDNQTVSTGILVAPVTSAANAVLNGGTFANGYAAGGATYNNGSFFGSVSFGAGSIMNADPGANFTAAGTTFASGATISHLTADNGGCTFQPGCVFNCSFVLGAASVINGGTFNSAISTVTSGTSPSIAGGTFAAGSVFTATTISDGTFPDGTAFHACTITGGNFGTTSTGCTVTGASSISGGAWTQLTVNSDVSFSGSPTFSVGLTIHYIRGPYTYNANIANLTISVPDPDYPAQAEVKAGTTVGNIGDGAGPLFTGTLSPGASRIGSGMIGRR